MEDHTPDNGETEPPKKTTTRNPNDPMGLLGWVIGGKYKVRSYVGGGGFGEVYEGFNTNLPEQTVIIKFFKRVQVPDKFDKEAKILCVLDHPNISRVIDYLPVEGALVIQFIDGKDVSLILNESGALSEKMWLRMARGLTDAVTYAHDKKIAHRDIKPMNILIDKNNRVYLIDFGIAKEIGGTATKTGYHALTPMFAAPERQRGGKEYNPFLSDIYELGITLYNCATLSMPYRNPVSPSLDEWGGQRAKRLSPQVRRILKKATHPDPLKRYQTARALQTDIQRVTHVYVRPRRWPIVALVAVVALAVGAYFMRDSIREYVTSLIPDTPDETTQVDLNAVDDGQQDIQAPPGDTATGEAAAFTEREPEQPPVVESPPPSLMVTVVPGNISRMDINGDQRSPGQHHELDSGRHVVSVVHPEYPVLIRRLTVTDAQEQVGYNLATEFAEAREIDILPVLIPPTDNHVLKFYLNGRQHTFDNFPVLDFSLLEGTWELKAEVTDRTEASRFMVVDSCVANPMGNGPRVSFTGSDGRIVLKSGESGKVRVFVYWARR